MCPWPSFSTCAAASPCTRLSRAPSTTSGSDFHDSISLPMDGPFSRPTRSIAGQDRRGSPRFRDASFSIRAVLSDPAGVSSSLACCGSLLVPSKFSTLSASGCSSHEAQSLHLRYSPDVARPTLRTLIEIELSTWPWSQFIVPVPMKHMGMQREVAHFGAGDHTARRVPSLVQLRLHPQAGRGARVADQIDHGLKGAERTASPVFRDVAEEAMLDLVPLAGARWEVRDVDDQTQVVGEALHFLLPGARPIPVAAARIGRDEQVRCLRIRRAAHHHPPLADRGDGE